MLSDRMQDALNAQINAEVYSEYLYYSMSSYLEEIGLSGFATWMFVQAQEEHTHAMKLYKYVIERGGRVLLDAVDAPKTEWESALDIYENALAHEQKVTGMINALVDLAIDESDHATNNMLQWFVAEQVEEEDNASTIVGQLEIVGDNPHALLMLDRELGQRMFVDETLAE